MSLQDYEKQLVADRDACDKQYHQYEAIRVGAERQANYWLSEGNKVRDVLRRVTPIKKTTEESV